MELGNDGMRHAIQNDWEGVTDLLLVQVIWSVNINSVILCVSLQALRPR